MKVGRLRSLLTGKAFTLGLIVFFISAVLLTLVIPQASRDPEAAAAFHEQAPGLARVLEVVGLDRIVNAAWFRLISAVAAVALARATFRLTLRDLRRLTRQRGPSAHGAFEVAAHAALREEIRRLRYRAIRRSATASRFVANSWGYAGPALLHLGMLAAMIGVLTVSLTQSAGLAQLVEGESLPAGTEWDAQRRGPISAPAALDGELVLERVDAEFWPNGEPRSYRSQLTLDAGAGVERFGVSAGSPETVAGVRFVQELRVGYAYLVTISRGEEQPRRASLYLPQPSSPDVPTYYDLNLGEGEVLQARLTVDERAAGSPDLTLRLTREGAAVAEAPLTSGSIATLDDVRVSADMVARWAVISFERSRGYGLLFASFFVIFLGAFLIYATPPRELTLTKRDDGTLIAEWYAPRFATLYAEEERRLREAAGGGALRNG